MACPFAQDSRGFEHQFATNHFGHFQLTARLWPSLKKANGARVVNLSSYAHFFSPIVFDDIHFNHRKYENFQSYGQSKTANILFTILLEELGKKDNIHSFAVHPGGIISTNLGRYGGEEGVLRRKAMGFIDDEGKPIINPFQQKKTVEQGASTQVWCATSPLLEGKGGVYCENNNITYLHPPLQQGADEKGFFGVCPYAINIDSAKKLWEVTENALGIQFN